MPWHPLLGTLPHAPRVAQSQGLPPCGWDWRSSHLGGMPGEREQAALAAVPAWNAALRDQVQT